MKSCCNLLKFVKLFMTNSFHYFYYEILCEVSSCIPVNIVYINGD